MIREAISTKAAPAAIGPYSQAMRAGNLLFVSGQIPIDPATGTLVAGNIAKETEQVLKNLKAVLAAAEATFSQVVKTTIFLRDMNDFQSVNEIYSGFFTEPYPARACIAAAGLPKDVRVEIEAIAILK